MKKIPKRLFLLGVILVSIVLILRSKWMLGLREPLIKYYVLYKRLYDWDLRYRAKGDFDFDEQRDFVILQDVFF